MFRRLLLLCLWALSCVVAFSPKTQAGEVATATPPNGLTVVLDGDYPPYVFRAPDGGYQGILVELWKLWEQKTGVPVHLRPMAWQAAQEAVLSGQADVIDMLFRTEERERLFAFSPPYATIATPIFVSKDLGGIHSLGGLQGFTVGVKRGDACVSTLSRRGVLSLATFDTYEDVIKAAKAGAIKIFCVDKPPALYYLYKNGLEKDYRLAFQLASGQLHRAVRLGNESLLHLVEHGFSRITPEEHAAIERKWLGEPLPMATWSHLWPWLLSAAVAIVLLLTFNTVLRRALRRQTSRLRDLLSAMGRSEARYRELVQGVSSIILRLSPEGRITFCNDYAQHFYGLSQNELLDRMFADLLEPAAEPDARGGSPFPLPLVAAPSDQGATAVRASRRHDGERVLLAWSVRALRDATGELVEILCVGNDITARQRAEEALRASEERYALVAKGANDGFWDWDLLHNKVYYSPRYLEILGYAPDELPAMAEEWSQRLHPDDAEAVIRLNKRCADGEVDHFSMEYRLRHKDGSYRWILGRGAALKDAAGRVIRLAGTHSDITNRKRDEMALRESQDQLAKIFRFSPVGIVLTSRREGRMLDLNEACARMFGFNKRDMLGRTSLELGLWRHPEDRDALMAEMAQHGAVMAKEMEANHENGGPMVILFSAVYNQAYGEPCILSVLVDISDRKAMEQALRRAKESAEAANRAKSEFLSTMSHEIRTPMNAILGMVDVLAGTDLDARQSRALKAIEKAGSNLLALLNNILDLSRIEAGRLIMEEKTCKPLELAATVVDMLRPGAARKGLALHLVPTGELPPTIACCPDRVHQVLINLVGNAIKFTAEGEIRLEVGPEASSSGPRLRLAVRDTGIGIPPDKLPLIFESFTQVDASSHRQAGGVGLGLTICKRLVELMGGSIRVESQPGQGSVFTVSLPLRPARDTVEETMPPAHTHPRTPPAVGNILLVEDSTTNAEVMRLLLEGEPFTLTWASGGEAALELFRNRTFDIVLMDVEMPGMDGYQTTEAMRRLENDLGRQHTVIIALTAHAFEEHRQRSLAAGCDDFQIKPIPRAKLLDLLHTWMAVRPD